MQRDVEDLKEWEKLFCGSGSYYYWTIALLQLKGM